MTEQPNVGDIVYCTSSKTSELDTDGDALLFFAATVHKTDSTSNLLSVLPVLPDEGFNESLPCILTLTFVHATEAEAREHGIVLFKQRLEEKRRVLALYQDEIARMAFKSALGTKNIHLNLNTLTDEQSPRPIDDTETMKTVNNHRHRRDQPMPQKIEHGTWITTGDGESGAKLKKVRIVTGLAEYQIITTSEGGGEITVDYHCDDPTPEDQSKWGIYYSAREMHEAMILAQACAGVDITTKEYRDSLFAIEDVLMNVFGDNEENEV